MIRIVGQRLQSSILDRHTYVCDLVNVEGPLLSLFRGARSNWLYLWCDTDEGDTDRWLIFEVNRENLVSYLSGKRTLRTLVVKQPIHWILDVTGGGNVDEEVEEKRGAYRYVRQIAMQAIPDSYLPLTDSYFDPSLAPDISLAQEIVPGSFDVHLAGDWFFSDLDRFSALYSQLYAFLYCTKPQFITNIGARVQKYLAAPWAGGYSRINLFSALETLVPSLHDLKIRGIVYNSPGRIRIEALKTVGDRLASLLSRYLDNEDAVHHAMKAINTALSQYRLRRRDLSSLPDGSLPISKEQKDFLRRWTQELAQQLGLHAELSELASRAPNVVVTAKVVMAVATRLKRLAAFTQSDLARL